MVLMLSELITPNSEGIHLGERQTVGALNSKRIVNFGAAPVDNALSGTQNAHNTETALIYSTQA